MQATGKPTGRKASLDALILVGAAAFLLGALVVAIASNALGPVRIDRQITGVVTVVNADGSAFCLLEDAGGAEFCSEALRRGNVPALIVGHRLTGTIVWTPVPGGSAEGLLITSAD